MSVASTTGSKVGSSVADTVALADGGGGGGGASYLNFTVAADDETPGYGSTLTLTATDVGYPSGTYAANDSTPTELDPVTFTFTPATKTYQWDKGGSDIVGATSNPLVISNVNPTDDDGDYYVTVTDPVTSESSRFGPVTIAVNAPIGYDTSSEIDALYGMRRLRTSWTGNLLRLRRGSDNAESDFGYNGSNDLDASAIATWLGGASGYVKTWYDQSGNGYNLSQTTTANQPLYVASGQNSKPIIRFDGANDRLFNASVSLAQPISALVVGANTSATEAGCFLDSYNSTQAAFYRGQTGDNPGKWVLVAGGTAITVTSDLAWHVFSYLLSGASSNLRVNQSATTGSPGTNGLSGFSVGNLRGNPNPLASTYELIGDIAELVVATSWDGTATAAAETIANDYWSVY